MCMYAHTNLLMFVCRLGYNVHARTFMCARVRMYICMYVDV